MTNQTVHLLGESEGRALGSALGPVDTFAGRVHVEWDPQAAVTPLGQLPFFTEFLQVSGLFDPWVSHCPLHLRSPNAPSKRDVLGTMVLSILAGHQRYAHINGVRNDTINPPLLGMSTVVSEDSVRRNLAKIDEDEGIKWLQDHLSFCVGPILGEPWIPRRRRYGQAALWPPGRRGEGVQSAYVAGGHHTATTPTSSPTCVWCWRGSPPVSAATVSTNEASARPGTSVSAG